MLNYARHNENAAGEYGKDQTRPYNKQLTAFLTLFAEDGAIFSMPTCMNISSGSGSGKTYDFNPCFIMPGTYQGSTACDYCAPDAIDGDFEYSGCFRPAVDNLDFAVRFYQPLWVGTGKAKQVKDAQLTMNEVTVNFSDVLAFGDWAGYAPGAAFTNFLTYYGVQMSLPAEMQAALAEYKAPTVDATEVKNSDAPTAPATTNVNKFTTKTKPAEIYAAAKAIVDADAAATPSFASMTEEEIAALDATTKPDEVANPDNSDGTPKAEYAQVAKPKSVAYGTEITTMPTEVVVPTLDNTKNTEPLIENLADGTGYKVTYKDNAGTDQTVMVGLENEEAINTLKSEIAAIKAKGYANYADGDISGNGTAATAAKNYFTKMKTYAENSTAYMNYKKDLEAYNAYYVGKEPLEVSDEDTNADAEGMTYVKTLGTADGVYQKNATTKVAATAYTNNEDDALLDYTTSDEYQNAQKLKAYNEAKAAYMDYQTKLAAYESTSAEDYEKWKAAKTYKDAYEAVKYTLKNKATVNGTESNASTTFSGYDNALAAFNADKSVYSKAKSDAEKAANADYMAVLKKYLRTDLGEAGADNRKALFKTSLIEKLPTVAVAAPDDLDILITDFGTLKDKDKGGIDGTFKFIYQNNNTNTNYPFHVYIPMEVTYYYANETPAKPILVFACIEVLSSKDNETGGN